MSDIRFSELQGSQEIIGDFRRMTYGELLQLAPEEKKLLNAVIESITSQASMLQSLHREARSRRAEERDEADSLNHTGRYVRYASTAMACGVQDAEARRISKEAHEKA